MIDATVIGAIVRAALQAAAGSAVASGVISGDDLTTAAGAITVLFSLAWSIWQKKRAAK
jgi:outer membrane lipoprotein SlyB